MNKYICTKEASVLIKYKKYDTDLGRHAVYMYHTCPKRGQGKTYIIHNYKLHTDKEWYAHIFTYNGKEVENAVKHFELI